MLRWLAALLANGGHKQRQALFFAPAFGRLLADSL
jgi:hypothetical protein